MKYPNIKAIVAFRESDLAIGNNLNLLYSFKTDLGNFKKKTIGDGENIVVMGRKTWESLGRWKPLPDRENLVVTRDQNLKLDGAKITTSKEDILAIATNTDKEIWIIGGSEIYTLFGDVISEIVATRVKGDEEVEANVFLPESFLEGAVFKKTNTQKVVENNRLTKNECTYWIETYKRIR